jgi:hypothetical protein
MIHVHVKRKGQPWQVEIIAADDEDLQHKLRALYFDKKAASIEGVDITRPDGAEYRRDWE